MTLEDFKEIHADDSPIRKLDLLLETMGNWRNDAVNRTDAKWRRNDEEVSYWDNEVKHMMNRSFWLYSELSNMLALQEPRVMTLEEALEAEYVYLDVRPHSSLQCECCILIEDEDGDIVPLKKGFWGSLECDDYGKEWRCWTSRPDKATREATPWE